MHSIKLNFETASTPGKNFPEYIGNKGDKNAMQNILHAAGKHQMTIMQIHRDTTSFVDKNFDKVSFWDFKQFLHQRHPIGKEELKIHPMVDRKVGGAYCEDETTGELHSPCIISALCYNKETKTTSISSKVIKIGQKRPVRFLPHSFDSFNTNNSKKGFEDHLKHNLSIVMYFQNLEKFAES